LTNEEKYHKRIKDKHDTVNKTINEKYESVKHLSKREVIIHLTEALDPLNPNIIIEGIVRFDNDTPDVLYKIDKVTIHKAIIIPLKDKRGKILKEILDED